MVAPAVIFGGAQALSGILGAVGGYSQQKAQTEYQNRARLRAYERQQQMYQFDVQRQLAGYRERTRQYKEQVRFNQEAAARGFFDEDRRLNEIMKRYRFQDQDMLKNSLGEQGTIAASMPAGRSRQRAMTLAAGDLGRNRAITRESISTAVSDAKVQGRRIRDELKVANAQAYGQVALTPMFGPAPTAPELAQGPSALGLLTGVVNAGLSGVSTAAGLAGSDSTFGKWLAGK